MKKVLSFIMFLCLATCFSFAGTTTNYRNGLIFAYSQANSVYEDENIKLEIYNEQLYATNKTQKTMFIDLSQCFMIHNGSSFPLFDNGGNGGASKKGRTTSIDEFITVAPTTGSKINATYICNMSTKIYGDYSTKTSPSGEFTDNDKRLVKTIVELLKESQSADPKGKEYFGTVSRHFTEDESVNNIGASIAYAFSKKAEEWNTVSLSTWVSDVIFAPFYVEMPVELTKKEKRGFDIKEESPAVVHLRANSPFEFDIDKSPIIVCDWIGNFKDGTFRLETTGISKTKGPSALQIIGAMFTYGLSLIGSYDTTYYKKIVKFDGTNNDWGKMKHVNSLIQTGQINK